MEDSISDSIMTAEAEEESIPFPIKIATGARGRKISFQEMASMSM